MAEIHIERKSNRAWLWWLLGLALLLLLAWWAVSRWRDNPTGPLASTADGTVFGPAPGAAVGGTTDTAAMGATGAPAAVGDYLRYVDERRARQAADRSHDYTADGIRRLAAAIGALSERNAGDDALRAELDAIRAQADSLQRSPRSTEHARYARESFRAAAGLMRTLQQRHYPNLANQVNGLSDAATAVRPGTPLLEQDAQIQRFFDQSGAALRTMSGGSS